MLFDDAHGFHFRAMGFQDQVPMPSATDGSSRSKKYVTGTHAGCFVDAVVYVHCSIRPIDPIAG